MQQQKTNLAVTFLLENEGAFLLAARSAGEDNFAQMWAFPGGRNEFGETIVDTARREVTEETGLELHGTGGVLDTYGFWASDGTWRVGIALILPVKSRDVVLSDENTAYKWVSSLEELAALKCIPGIHNHFVNARAFLDSGQRLFKLDAFNLTPDKYLNR